MESFACHDHNGQGAALVAGPVHSPRDRPLVRLVEDDYDGVYDDLPVKAIAAA